MDQVRLLLAIGLSFLVLFVWSMFFADRQPVINDPQTVQSKSTTTDNQVLKNEALPKTDILKQGQVDSMLTAQSVENPAREIVVETPFYTVQISTRGAAFTSYVLKNYRETVDKDSPNKELIPKELKNGVFRTALFGQSVIGLDDAVYSIDQSDERLVVTSEKKSLVFSWVNSEGSALIKTYTFDPESYLIDLDVLIKNSSAGLIKDQLVLSVRKPVEEDKGYGFVGPSGLIDDELEQVKIKKIEDRDEYKGLIKWIGIEDQYFLSSIIPSSPTSGSMKLILTDNLIVSQLINPQFELPSGAQEEFRFFLFMGPKSMELLDSLGHDLGKALNFGFFNVIAKPCLWFMNKIHSVIPNYGIAIILLTLFTKIILWPLGSKSYKSMSEMKKLQPLMTELREKHKNDKQKMNQELMALYRTYKVNPMGGCLPMVLQIPVFFALYRMLYQAIELRHAPFVFWINDLSAPDRLFDFGFAIPFMEPPYGIPVLTIIMGATMLLQQKMSPPPGDPTQAKMMMLMPVVFTFIFINFSSGLVLYWLVNNVLSISQQYYVQQKTI